MFLFTQYAIFSSVQFLTHKILTSLF